jgi:DNA primase
MTATVRFNEDKERVRDASDIVRVIGEHIALKAKGREFAGLCPFHDDHKPSMMVSPGKQLFKCFVCGAGGDVFGFVQKYHSMEFREALEYLAERAGIVLTPRGRGNGSCATNETHASLEAHESHSSDAAITRADLIRANAEAAEFFRLILKREDLGAVGRQIIAKRGIAPAMVEQFGIGLAPDRWDGLLLTIQGKGLDVRAFAEAGLLKHRDSGGLYDAFRNRLMFPIQDQIGRVIAFGARRINEEDEPKYLNSAETRLFQKSSTLFGLFQAARAIQTERTAIITEGYTDTIACHQAGITNAVATLGTALTRGHATVLRRLCDTVVLLFDGDDAGRRAAERAFDVYFKLFFAEELDVRIATLATVTDAKDPDELLKRDGGAEILRGAIKSAPTLLQYHLNWVRASMAGHGAAAIGRAIDAELQRLVQLGLNEVRPLRRKLIIRHIAEIVGVDEATIGQTIPGGRQGPPLRLQAEPPSAGVGRLGTLEQALGCMLCEPTLWLTLSDADREALDPAHLEAGAARVVAEAMFDLAAAGHGCGISAVIALLDDPDTQAAATEMHARMSDVTSGDPARVREYFRDCLRSLGQPEASLSIESLRSRHAATGGNRRVIPRPRMG